MPQPKPHDLTAQAYLTWEAEQRGRHEFVDGEIHAMTGATVRHNRLVVQLARVLGRALGERPCEVLAMDVKLRVARANAFYYPDLLVRCGSLAGDALYVEDPVLVVEVLSPSTEATDRREKLHAYRQLPSLQEYVLVAQDVQQAEIWRRHGDIGWQYASFEAGSDLDLQSVGARVPLGELYAGTDVPERAPEPQD